MAPPGGEFPTLGVAAPPREDYCIMGCHRESRGRLCIQFVHFVIRCMAARGHPFNSPKYIASLLSFAIILTRFVGECGLRARFNSRQIQGLQTCESLEKSILP